jgi:UDP-N-acetylmuramoylalanine--D-glutamate ligase
LFGFGQDRDLLKQQGIPIVRALAVASSVCLAPIIAITGTKGKTTTALLTGEILKQSNFRRVCVAGNIGEPFSNVVLELTAEDIVVAEVRKREEKEKKKKKGEKKRKKHSSYFFRKAFVFF